MVKGLAHRRSTNTQVTDLGIHQWSYLPLTRTPRKLLTCGFATPWRSPARCVPIPSAKRPESLRDRLDEHGIANLITAHGEGTTAASHAAVRGVDEPGASAEIDASGFRSLDEGQRVQFDIRQGDKGQQATGVRAV